MALYLLLLLERIITRVIQEGTVMVIAEYHHHVIPNQERLTYLVNQSINQSVAYIKLREK